VQTSNASVLVVDDDAAVRTLMERVLKRAGYAVVTARHGGEAISQLSDGAFDVILLDMMMPVSNGFDFGVLRRGAGIECRLHGGTETADQLREGEVSAFVKPFDLHELCATVDRYAGAGHRPPASRIDGSRDPGARWSRRPAHPHGARRAVLS
jgi:CheY-like chemotaxis protein